MFALKPLGLDLVAVRAGVAVVALLVGAGGAALAMFLSSRESRKIREHFRAIGSLDPQQLHDPAWEEHLPPLPRGSHWESLSRQLRSNLMRYWEESLEQNHSRTSLEIRCRQAEAETQRIRAILAALEEPVVAVDAFDELTYANQAAEPLLACTHGNAVRQAMAQVVRCEKLVRLLQGTAQRGSSVCRTEEIELDCREGQVRHYRATVTSLAASSEPGGEPGQSFGAVAVLRPVSQEKAIHKRHAEFVSSAAHEMKTPLASIKAYVELLADGDAEDEETRENFLQVINSQADRLQRLVDNMLNLARIEAGVVKVNKKNLSLNEVLEEAANVVLPTAETKQIELAKDLSPMYLAVLADRDLLLQAAINLLSNAVKYTPEGGKVTLRSRLADDCVVFEVQDTGVGIDAEDCRRVFDRFYRVRRHENMARGTGLGLALVKHIVEDVHGGRISVSSTPGEGSTFTVQLTPSSQTR